MFITGKSGAEAVTKGNKRAKGKRTKKANELYEAKKEQQEYNLLKKQVMQSQKNKDDSIADLLRSQTQAAQEAARAEKMQQQREARGVIRHYYVAASNMAGTDEELALLADLKRALLSTDAQDEGKIIEVATAVKEHAKKKENSAVAVQGAFLLKLLGSY